MPAVIDMTGETFGRYTVLAYEGKTKDRKSLWRCKCECGNVRVVLGKHLRSGHTASCGCYAKDRIRETKTIHGHKTKGGASRTYLSWRCMHKRCSDPTWHAFEHYGGRGIRVCDRWADFSAFLDDMGERPEGRTLDRIDTDGDYAPANCRWASHSEQVRNRRKRG